MPAFPAGPPVPPAPPPWAYGGWPGPAYPPPTERRDDRRKWAWIGGVTAAVVAVTVCTGLIAVASEPDPAPGRSAAGPAPDSPSVSIAPSQAPPAPIVPLEALPRLLLDAGIVNSIEGATDIRAIPDPHADSPFSELSSDRPDCEGIQHPALTEALRGSGYLGVQTQFLRGDGHLVSQAVVDYPSAESATKFAAQQAESWGKCDGKPLTLTTPAEGSVTFTVGTVTNRDGMLSVVFTQEGARGWACQRALTARNNVVIDTRSCGFNRTDQAVTEAARMADRVSAQ
ncbi:sensor domain-containing protein [Mycobacterium sp. 1081908.1]|uniref:sensor domain-containing protein n=1 Tax=Mycobacterium sp. 1081908.1 TaxID=1834066 RepID=UPI000B28A37F|nr:sensor domain-containing protein [Mycobacterium sp. 1081908.1]